MPGVTEHPALLILLSSLVEGRTVKLVDGWPELKNLFVLPGFLLVLVNLVHLLRKGIQLILVDWLVKGSDLR